MMTKRAAGLSCNCVVVWLALCFFGTVVLADQASIIIDDVYSDWDAVAVAHSDPIGDVGGGQVDFARLWLADDPRFLFLRLEVGIDIDPSENNDLRLYLDTDDNAATGLSIAGIGAELEWRFGSRNGTFRVGGSTTVFHDDIRLRSAPAVTGSQLEIAIGRDTLPDGSNPLFSGTSIRVVLIDDDGSDQLPDGNGGIAYTLDVGSLPPDVDIPLAREAATDLRMVTYNVLNDSPWDPALEDRFGRQLAAVAPDILSFQEIRDHDITETIDFVETWLPSGPGEAWYGAAVSDCKTVSRFPVLGSWALDNNLAVWIDTTSQIDSELLLINAHLPCCANDSGRQQEVDRIMAFIRDAKLPGGVLTLAADTPIVITGDLNLVGLRQQLTSLLTGDIVNAGFGPDFDPDWDGTPLTNLISRQTEKRMSYTWRNDSSSFWPGHLDYQIYSDSVLDVPRSFILYTPEMADPAASGMQSADSTASDHLLFCADYRPVAPAPEPELTTIPGDGGSLDFGSVRVGTAMDLALTASNTGDTGSLLSGMFPAATGAFSPASATSFGPLVAGATDQRFYTFTPFSRGIDSHAFDVISDGGSSTVTLDGIGVGPVFEASRAPGSELSFATVRSLDRREVAMVIRNATPDVTGDAQETDLTLLSVTIDGPHAGRFTAQGVAPGTVLAPDDNAVLTVRFLGAPIVGDRSLNATLIVSTDSGAAYGQPGTQYSWPLSARSVSASRAR